MFGYPGKPDFLVDPNVEVIPLMSPTDDLAAVFK